MSNNINKEFSSYLEENGLLKAIGGEVFIQINVCDAKPELNPFLINTRRITYVREFKDDKKKDSVAIFVGQKMYITDTTDFGLFKSSVGDVIKVGNSELTCVKGDVVSNKASFKYLVNFANIMHLRNFVDNNDSNSNNYTKKSDKDFNKFALVTENERIIPVNELFIKDYSKDLGNNLSKEIRNERTD